jgi:4-hydroxy 2-oxovalerate aldolase
MKALIHDVTCRDGNHALKHSITRVQVASYAQAAWKAGVKSIEVGHGNGLGGSSSLVGHSAESDFDLVSAAKEGAPDIRVGVHAMPSFATIRRDLLPAIEAGATYFRLGAHVTEMDTIERHARTLLEQNVNVAAAVMMVSHASLDELFRQIEIIESFGVKEIVLMDSVGRLIPEDVAGTVRGIRSRFSVEVGFHAHDNFGLAVGNALVAWNEGATTLDASSLGMGAGAGNAPLELLSVALNLSFAEVGLSPEAAMELASYSETIGFTRPNKSVLTAATAFSNLFSGFAPVIQYAAKETGVDPLVITKLALGKKLVAGQENVIYEIAEGVRELS